jgi:DsbC/DsbD-like thiol-disulfide interchange protein
MIAAKLTVFLSGGFAMNQTIRWWFCIGAILLSACNRRGEQTADSQIAPNGFPDQTASVVESKPSSPITKTFSPVSASLRVVKSDLHRSDEFNLVIDVQIAAGWHIYAIDRRAGAAAPTKIHLQLPKGLESTEKWTSPEPMLSPALQGEPVFVYEGNAKFLCSVRVLPDAPLTKVPVRCTLVYQACDQFSCRPPEEVALETDVHVVP